MHLVNASKELINWWCKHLCGVKGRLWKKGIAQERDNKYVLKTSYLVQERLLDNLFFNLACIRKKGVVMLKSCLHQLIPNGLLKTQLRLMHPREGWARVRADSYLNLFSQQHRCTTNQ